MSVKKITGLFERAWPVFSWTVVNDEEYWPWSTPTGVDRDDAGPGSPVVHISIPKTFWRRSEVNGELVAFLLAHEISHGLATGFTCHDGAGELVCEGQCDWWAANRVMREVFSDAEYVSIMVAAAEQMAEYHDGLYGATAECGEAICSCDDASCGYPPKTCRVRTMLAALTIPPRRPGCVRNWQDSFTTACAEFSACP